MPFLTDLHGWDTQWIAGTDKALTEAELRYFSPLLGREIVVPSGYKTDFATIPKAAHSFMHPASKHIRVAAVIHDYIYTDLCAEISKAQADAILREAMGQVVCPAPKWKRNVVWLAVKVGGKGNWSAI